MLASKRLITFASLLCLLASQSLFAQTQTPATVPASFVGTYDLTFSPGFVSGGPFASGDKATVVVGSDNSMCVNGAVLTNPVFINGNNAEAVWSDTPSGVAYAMSNFLGTFNEVNVLGIGANGSFSFYGQLKGSKVSDSTSCSSTPTTSTPASAELIAQVFALAETKLPEFFPGGAITLTFEGFTYRFYPQTSIYLAVADNAVYLLGGAFGEAIVNIGPLSSVLATLETYETPSTGGTVTQPPATALWNLSISGSFNSSFIQNIAFSNITLENIPAPDLNDTNAITSEINNSLAGVATGISSISITVVNNTDSRRTFDVSFGATLQGLGAVTYNLRYDYTS